ncbi:MAG: lysophospholipid acyltransferase family protein [Gemmatimonadota bacterium]
MEQAGLIMRAVGWTVGVFHSVERLGEPVPAGPVLVVANHPNALLDPLVIFRVAGRPTRPLAKAPLFEQRFVGTLLRGMGGLPVYRAQDDASLMHRNDDTFRGAIAALRDGEAVQIYPEGRSHSEPSLVPMRTGAARIALGAEAESGWTLGLRIVPIGLTYERKSSFRGRVIAMIGEPFTIAGLGELHEVDAPAAVRALTDEIAARLHDVTVNVAEHRDAELIDTAERLYAREKGISGWRERDPLAARLPRLRAFADGLARLRAADPGRHQRLARTVAHYRHRAALLGVQDGDVPPAYTIGGTLRYIAIEGAFLLVLLPLAAIGTIVWYPTYVAPHVTLRIVRPDIESVATYKLATGFVMVPLTLLAGAIAGFAFDGLRGVLIALALLPVSGLATIAWHDRRRRFAEDARLFFRVLTRRDHQARLAAERARLTAEFDELMVKPDAGVGESQYRLVD